MNIKPNHMSKNGISISSNFIRQHIASLPDRSWINGRTPLVDIFADASSDVVDFHVSTLFQSLNSKKNYLRIQDDTLSGVEASVDIATPENMQRIVEIGNKLLEKPISRVNLETGRYEEIKGEGLNSEALTRFAKLLSEERKRRLESSNS